MYFSDSCCPTLASSCGAAIAHSRGTRRRQQDGQVHPPPYWVGGVPEARPAATAPVAIAMPSRTTNNTKVFMTMSGWMLKIRCVLMTEPRRGCIDLNQGPRMQFAVTSVGNLPPGSGADCRLVTRPPAREGK